MWFDLLSGDCCTMPYLNVAWQCMYFHNTLYITCTVICYQHSQNVRTFYFFTHPIKTHYYKLLYLCFYLLYFIYKNCLLILLLLNERERKRERESYHICKCMYLVYTKFPCIFLFLNIFNKHSIFLNLYMSFF